MRTAYQGHPTVLQSLLGRESARASSVSAQGKALQVSDGYATLVMTSQNKVSLLVDVPMADLLNMSQVGVFKGRALIHALARDAGVAGRLVHQASDGFPTRGAGRQQAPQDRTTGLRQLEMLA